MSSLKVIETEPGEYSLTLDAGSTAVEDVIDELGHEANGYFWESLAQFLVHAEAPVLEGRFTYDSEADMFCAYGADRGALEELAIYLNVAVADADRLRQIVGLAETEGFEFDD